MPATAGTADQPRVGDLTPGWRITVLATWILVFFAYAALWKASDEIGIGTWWLGSRSQPTLIVVRLLPFVLASAVAIAAASNARRLPVVGVAASLLIALSAVMEVVGRWSFGLAMVEFAIAVGALLVSLGSFTGGYRAAPPAGATSTGAVTLAGAGAAPGPPPGGSAPPSGPPAAPLPAPGAGAQPEQVSGDGSPG